MLALGDLIVMDAHEPGDPSGPSAAPATRYLADLLRRPAPKPEAERELVRAAQRGDPHARERLVETFLPRLAGIARMYRGSPIIHQQELLQEGVVGLLEAHESYDPARGSPFWPYARRHVIRAIRRLVSEQARPVVLSDRALRSLQRRRQAEPVGRRGDHLVDPRAETAYERLLDEIGAEDLLRLLAALSRRERAVLRARRGLPRAERGFEQIGEPLGLGSARVRQIERRARGKLAAQRASERG